jgi:hypothetical protein
MTTKMLTCRSCHQEIAFDDYHVSASGKKIPLDPERLEPHQCEVWKAQHRKLHDCRNNCGSKIYFDDKQKTDKGKWMPIDNATGSPHDCPKSDYSMR